MRAPRDASWLITSQCAVGRHRLCRQLDVDGDHTDGGIVHLLFAGTSTRAHCLQKYHVVCGLESCFLNAFSQ